MEDFLASVITPEWNRRLDGGADWNEEVEALSARFPHHAQAIHAYRDRSENMLAGSIDDTVRILADLRRAGYELHALTNWSARTFPIARERFAFLDWFGEIVVSGEVGTTSPTSASTASCSSESGMARQSASSSMTRPRTLPPRDGWVSTESCIEIPPDCAQR